MRNIDYYLHINFAKQTEIQMSDIIFDGDLKLNVPSSFSNYDYFEVCRITDTLLDDIGIKKNSLAIVVNEKVKRGDIIALLKIADGALICGMYDEFFGIVSVSGFDMEELLFRTEEVEVVGKVIGVGEMQDSPINEIVIEPVAV